MAKERYEVVDTETGEKLPVDKFLLEQVQDGVVREVMEKIERQRDGILQADFLKKMVLKDQPGNGKRG